VEGIVAIEREDVFLVIRLYGIVLHRGLISEYVLIVGELMSFIKPSHIPRFVVEVFTKFQIVYLCPKACVFMTIC